MDFNNPFSSSSFTYTASTPSHFTFGAHSFNSQSCQLTFPIGTTLNTSDFNLMSGDSMSKQIVEYCINYVLDGNTYLDNKRDELAKMFVKSCLENREYHNVRLDVIYNYCIDNKCYILFFEFCSIMFIQHRRWNHIAVDYRYHKSLPETTKNRFYKYLIHWSKALQSISMVVETA